MHFVLLGINCAHPLVFVGAVDDIDFVATINEPHLYCICKTGRTVKFTKRVHAVTVWMEVPIVSFHSEVPLVHTFWQCADSSKDTSHLTR